MGKNAIIGIVVAVLAVVAAGVAGYSMLQGDEQEDRTSNTASEKSAEKQAEKGQSVFNAMANDTQPFEALMIGKGEREYTATLRYDGKGNSSYLSDYGDGNMTMYLFGDEYISCFGEMCMRLPDANGDGNVSKTKRTYTQAELDGFRNSAVLRQTNVPCGQEKCSVWDVKTGEFTGVFYLDGKGRMQKVEGVQDGATWTIEYTYKPVSITKPANVVDSPMR